MLSTCLDASKGHFFVVGKGVVPDTNDYADYETKLIKQRQAARKSAEKWALYLKTLLKYNDVRYGNNVLGKVMYSKIPLEEICEDTVYQFFKVPITSVVVW